MAVTLDIFSDPVCPWCLIGKAGLDAAIADRPNHPFRIAWHPFFLNPDMPAEGLDRQTYFTARFGGPEDTHAALAPVQEAARSAGVEIAWDKITHMPNTVDAHRLIHWAGLEGVQQAAVAALFRAHFEEGRDIGDRATLLAIAEASGMEPDMVARLYDSGADRAHVLEREAHARTRGISAVPTFIVGDRHAVAGAQSPDLWRSVIDELTLGGTPVEGEA